VLCLCLPYHKNPLQVPFLFLKPVFYYALFYLSAIFIIVSSLGEKKNELHIATGKEKKIRGKIHKVSKAWNC
jgi:hypothetical protein